MYHGGITVNTKHLYNICKMLVQRRRHCAGVVQMLYTYFVFAGIAKLFDLDRTIEIAMYLYNCITQLIS